MGRSWLVVLVSSVLLIACGKREWRDFTSKDGAFTVELPGTPAIDTQASETKLGAITLKLFTLELDGGDVAYVVTYNDYPPAMLRSVSVDTILDGVVEGALRNGGTLRDKKTISVAGFPARDVIANVNVHLEYIGRFVLADKRLYQITIVSRPGKVTKEDKRRFFDSFKLLRTAATPTRDAG